MLHNGQKCELTAMWFNFWTGGFLAGLVLAKTWQFYSLPWPLLAFMSALLLLRSCRHVSLWAVCGFGWGSFHNAPSPSQSLAVVQPAQHNPLQFFFSDIIVTDTSHRRWQVRGHPDSQGSVPQLSGKQRYFIFARPPYLHARDSPSAPAIVLEPRLHLLHKTDNLPEPVSSWIASITLGKRKQMPTTLRESFRLLGLFHILVISGLHITIIALGSRKCLDLALRSLYIVRLLTPTTWLWLAKIISLLSCLLIIFYGCLVGFSPPAQRAVLIFIVHQGYALAEREATLSQKIKLVLFLQMLLFPIGFLSDTLLLSWGAYLIVLHCFQMVKQAPSIGGKLAALLRGQLVITALILCFFKELSVLSIPLNILLLPLIPYIMMSGLLLLLLPAHTTTALWLEQSHLFFLQQIDSIAQIASTYSWLTIDIGNSVPLQVALFSVLIIMVLSRTVFMTKRKVERD